MLDGQRILVTGATGQVARPIAEALAADNEVWAAARFRDNAARAELEAAGIATVAFDLGDAALDHLPDVHYVIHCAAATAPATAAGGLRVNAEGTGLLMNRYRTARAFYYMSSSSVYREKADEQAVYTEDDDLGGSSPYSPHYAMSKLCAEAVVRFQSRSLGLPTIMGRLNVAYGTAGHGGLPVVLFDLMAAGVPFRHRPGHQSWCSPIHQDDIVAQVQGLLAHAAVGAPVVNLGGDEPVSLEQIIGLLEELTGLTMPMEAADDTTWHTQVLDASLRRELAGPCRVTWRDGVRSALQARRPGAVTAG